MAWTPKSWQPESTWQPKSFQPDPEAVQPSDTWDYVMQQGGSLRQAIALPQRPAYDELLSTVQNPKEFEDRMAASLYLASTFQIDTDQAYDLQTDLARQLFKQPMSPSQMVSRAMQDEKLINRWIQAWKSPVVAKQSFWERRYNDLSRGLAGLQSTMTGLVATVQESDLRYGPRYTSPEQDRAMAAENREKAKVLWQVAQDPEIASRNEGIAEKVLSMAIENLPYVAGTTAASFLFGPAGGYTVGGAAAYNNSYQTAKANNVPEDKARKIAAANFILSGAIESFGGPAADKLMTKATEKITNRIARGIADLTIGSLTEAGEESSQELASIAGEMTYRDVDWKEAITRTAIAGAGGFAVGGVFKTGSATLRGVTNFADQKRALRVLAAEGELTEQVVSELEQTVQMQEVADAQAKAEDTASGAEQTGSAATPVAAREGAIAEPSTTTEEVTTDKLPQGQVVIFNGPVYHNTDRASAEAIVQSGFKVEDTSAMSPAERGFVAGNLGDGVYLSPLYADNMNRWGGDSSVQVKPVRPLRLFSLGSTEGAASINIAKADELKAQGYDGIIVNDPHPQSGGFQVVVFDPSLLQTTGIVEDMDISENDLQGRTVRLTTEALTTIGSPPAQTGEPGAGAATVKQAAPAQPDMSDTEYKAMRKKELARTTRAIKQSGEYQMAEEESRAKGYTPTGVGLFYFEPKYKGDIEGAFGPKGGKGSNKAAWSMVSFEKGSGQGWDQAQQELNWGETFDDFLARLKDFSEGDVAPDLLDVAQSSDNIDLQAAAVKRAMLLSSQPVADINAAIEDTVRSGGKYQRLSDEDIDAIIEEHRIRMATGQPSNEIDVSIGAASGNFMSRRRAVERAQREAGRTGKPMYVVQRANGTFVALDQPPAKGHYTVVDMKKPLADQVTFIKQASPTVEESFDYAEKPKESQKHMTELQRFKARMKDKAETADAIKKELLDYVTANVPAELQGKFLPLMRAINAQRNTKTNLKDLMKGIAQTERLLQGFDKKDAINELKKTWGKIKKTYRRREMALGAMDKATREKLTAVMDGIDLAELSEGKKQDLASLGRYLNQLADEVAAGLRTMTEAQDAIIRIPKARLEALDRLGKTPVQQMEADDIRDLTVALQQYVHNYEFREQLKGKRRGRVLKKLREQAIGEIIPTRQAIEGESDLATPRRENFARRVFGTDSSRVDTLIDGMVGPGATTTKQLLDEDLHEGWRKRAELTRKAIEYIRERLKAIGFTYDDFRRLQEARTVTLSGKQYPITGDDALAFYLHAKWDANVRRLLTTQELEIQGKTAPTIASLMELEAIIGTLSEKERAYGDLFEELNRDVLRPAINPVALELDGAELATEEKYFPIHRVMPRRVAGTVADTAIEDYGPFQPRTGGTHPIRIVPFTRELMNVVQMDAMYAGMALPMYNARALLNSGQWQTAARQAGYQDSVSAIITIMQRVQGFPTSQSYLEMMGQKVLNRISKSILSARIGTVLSQTSVIPMAYAEVDAKHFVGVKPSLARLERLKKYSAILWERWESSQVSIEMGNIAAQHAAENLLFSKMGWTDKPLRAMTRMDAEAIEIIAGAIENEIAAGGMARGTPEFDQAVADRTEYVVRRTQQMWDMLDRSVLSSDPSLAWRTALIFRSAQEAMLNVLLRANHKYARNGDKKEWARQAGAILASATMQAAMRKGLRWGLRSGAVAGLVALGAIQPGEEPEEEDRDSIAARLAADTTADLVALLPLGNAVGPIIRDIPNRIQGKPKWNLEPYDNPMVGVLTNVYGLYSSGANLAEGLMSGETYSSGPNKGEPKWERAAWGLADSALEVASKLTGAPYSGPRSELREPVGMIVNAVQIQGMTNGELRKEIRANTYRETNDNHRAGTPHEGKDKYVNMLRTELEKRE